MLNNAFQIIVYVLLGGVAFFYLLQEMRKIRSSLALLEKVARIQFNDELHKEEEKKQRFIRGCVDASNPGEAAEYLVWLQKKDCN